MESDIAGPMIPKQYKYAYCYYLLEGKGSIIAILSSHHHLK